MKLEIGNLYIKDVQFGDHDAFENGVLTIDKAAAISYLKECDDHITDLDIVIALPGDDTRIVPVIETVEPRVRMDGRTLFPGVTDEGAEAEGYFARGCRGEKFLEDKRENTAAYRGVQMLVKKIYGKEYQTELVIPKKELIPIAEPVADLSKASIALVTTGGIVPVANPDRIQSASATRWGGYDVTGMERLEGGVFKTIHAGFDPAAANADPNVIVPVDAMRAYEKEGKIGKLHEIFYSTVRTGTTEAEARRMAQEIIPQLIEANVSAVIMGST